MEEFLGNILQRTDKFFFDRLGRFTSSEMYKLMTEPRSAAAKAKGKLSDGAMTYVTLKVSECLTGQPKVSAYAPALDYGTEMESEAIEYFLNRTGFQYRPSEFVKWGEHAGGSPDGLINLDALLEVKCPFVSETQVDYLMLTDQWDLKRQFPEYYWQCMSNLLFTEKEILHFVTYDPRMKLEKHKMVHITVSPQSEDFQLIVDKLAKAIEEKLKMLNLLFN